MTDQDLIKRLSKINKIKPSEDYALISRSILLNKEAGLDNDLVSRLNMLRAIQPRTEFALKTKDAIHAIAAKPPLMDLGFNIKNMGTIPRLIHQSLSFSMAIALSIIAITVITTTPNIKEAFLPELSALENEDLAIEADNLTKDINIKLLEAEYFASSANKTTMALSEALTKTGSLK
ncbi:MAG TPA: hypothetical protein VI432_01540 [Candidatus Paceibacterota bacterium]